MKNAEHWMHTIDRHYHSGVHTWGPCSTEGCIYSARGSYYCAGCAESKLGEIVGRKLAFKYWNRASKKSATYNRILREEDKSRPLFCVIEHKEENVRHTSIEDAVGEYLDDLTRTGGKIREFVEVQEWRKGRPTGISSMEATADYINDE